MVKISLCLNTRIFIKMGVGNWIDWTGIWLRCGSQVEIIEPEIVAYGNEDLVAVAVYFRGEISYLLVDDLSPHFSELVH